MIREDKVGVTFFRSEWQKASLSILYTYSLIRNSHQAFHESHGLTSPQYSVLRILRDRSPVPVSASFLRQKMPGRMPDVPRLLERLSAKGLVEATRNTADKRLMNIVLSQEGQRVIDSLESDEHQLDAPHRGGG